MVGMPSCKGLVVWVGPQARVKAQTIRGSIPMYEGGGSFVTFLRQPLVELFLVKHRVSDSSPTGRVVLFVFINYVNFICLIMYSNEFLF